MYLDVTNFVQNKYLQHQINSNIQIDNINNDDENNDDNDNNINTNKTNPNSHNFNFNELFILAEEVVYEIRLKITNKTNGLTASAGIGVNFLIAKIAADINKPNGQYIVKPTVGDIKQFISPLSTRKIPGIGIFLICVYIFYYY